MFQTKNILVLAPHTDDGELGCGASIAKYVSEGKNVFYVAFSACARSLPDGLPADTLVKECRNATKSLGVKEVIFYDFEVREFNLQRQDILEKLVELNKALQPQTILIPSQHDIHQDHQVIHAEALRAFKNCNVLGYELPWNDRFFAPSYFEQLSEEYLSGKIQSLSHYKSQSHRNYMKPDVARSLARVRGVQCGSELAEAFEVYKIIGTGYY